MAKLRTPAPSKLKVAVQLFGNLRTYENCAPALKTYVLDRYDCDVFMHTWDQLEHTSQTWYADKHKSNPLTVTDEVIARLHTLYQPKAIKVEAQNFLNEPGTLGQATISLNGIKYMLYSQHQSSLLREAYAAETGTVYDYVITLRPDIKPFVPLELAHYQREFNFTSQASVHLVHALGVHQVTDRLSLYPRMLDCFYLAPPATMSIITGLYTHFDRFLRDYPTQFPDVDSVEAVLHEYLLQQGVLPRIYRFHYAIKRKDDARDVALLPPHQQTLKTHLRHLRHTAPRSVFHALRGIALEVLTLLRLSMTIKTRHRLDAKLVRLEASTNRGMRKLITVLRKYLTA